MPITTRKTKRNHFNNGNNINRHLNRIYGPLQNVGPRVIVPHIIENLLPRNNSPRVRPNNNSSNSNSSYNRCLQR